MQSGPVSRTECDGVAIDVTPHSSSEPAVLNKRFFVGVVNGLFLSAICWILLYPIYRMFADAH